MSGNEYIYPDSADLDLDLGFDLGPPVPVPVPEPVPRKRKLVPYQKRLNAKDRELIKKAWMDPKITWTDAPTLEMNADRSGANYVSNEYDPNNLESFKDAWMDPDEVLKKRK